MSESPFVFEAIGTHWQIDVYDVLSSERRKDVLRRVRERIDAFDKTYSRFRADSLVTEMSYRAGTYTLPDDAKPMFDLYRTLYDLTDGAFTPLIGQVLSDAGYDASYSLKSKPLTKPPAWDDAMAFDGTTLTMKQPTLLDFGAAGKGYLIDIIGGVLTSEGIGSFCIDAGGDILHHSVDEQTLRVGLEHPGDKQKVIGVATIGNESICGSAGNRRSWGAFHHTIDPRTLASPRHILAVWTIAKTALVADGLATALSFTTPEVLANAFDFAYLILYPDYSTTASQNFPAELFTA